MMNGVNDVIKTRKEKLTHLYNLRAAWVGRPLHFVSSIFSELPWLTSFRKRMESKEYRVTPFEITLPSIGYINEIYNDSNEHKKKVPPGINLLFNSKIFGFVREDYKFKLNWVTAIPIFFEYLLLNIGKLLGFLIASICIIPVYLMLKSAEALTDFYYQMKIWWMTGSVDNLAVGAAAASAAGAVCVGLNYFDKNIDYLKWVSELEVVGFDDPAIGALLGIMVISFASSVPYRTYEINENGECGSVVKRGGSFHQKSMKFGLGTTGVLLTYDIIAGALSITEVGALSKTMIGAASSKGEMAAYFGGYGALLVMLVVGYAFRKQIGEGLSAAVAKYSPWGESSSNNGLPNKLEHSS
jgi:hypothetical protein